MIETQSRKLLDLLLARLDPGSNQIWAIPKGIPKSEEHISREDWVMRLTRLGESANLHLVPKEMDIESFRKFLSEPFVPAIVFAGDAPVLVENIRKLGLTISKWRGNHYEQEKAPVEQVVEMVDREDAGTILVLLPIKAPPLVSDISSDGEKPSPARRLWRLLGSERKEIAYIYVYAIMVGLLSLTLPLGVQAIVGQVAGGLILEPAFVLIGLVILGTALSGALQVMQAYIVEKIQQRLFAKAAFEFASRIPRFSYEHILDFYPPELTNRFFDILTVQKGLSKILNDFIGAVLAILFGLILLSLYHPFFIAFGLVLLAFLYLIFRLTGNRGLDTSLAESKYKYRVAHWLQEIARTLRSFKLSGHSRLPMEKTDREVTNYLKVRKKHFRVLITQMSSIILFKTIITGGLLIMGSILVVSKDITLGQFVASEIVIITILNSVEKIFGSLDTIYDLLTAVEKIGNVTDIESEKTGVIRLPVRAEGIHLKVKNLGYTYPGNSRPTIQDISFEVKPGQKIGITGFTDSGKTTLLRTVAGLLQTYSGQIDYDEVSLKDLDMNHMRLYIGDVHAYGEIFEGTLLENLIVGRPGIGLEEVRVALKLVGIQDYVNGLPNGLGTEMVAGAPNMGSGLVKKIILARNLIGPPRLLIFNDFFLNLEAEFRHQLREKVLDKTHKWTVLAVTQDPIFLQSCDSILLMEDGKLLAQGTYNELIKNERFRKLLFNGDSENYKPAS